jgi:MFS family permease
MSLAESTSPPSSGTEARGRHWESRQVAALAIVAFCGVLVSLTQSILIPVLGAIQLDLGTTTTQTEWLLTSTLLVAAVAVPVFGRLGDLHGKRLMLLVAAAALAVGSLVCALSDSIGWMIVGRVVVGLSTAAIPLGIS